METTPEKPVIHIALIGDYQSERKAHQAIPLALDDAAAVLEISIEYHWLGTDQLDDFNQDNRYQAIWVTPGSPYQNSSAVCRVIKQARENSTPILGSCAGFQHMLIEYAMNVLGWQAAVSAENSEQGSAVITPLSCELLDTQGIVELRPHTRIAKAYQRDEITESYHCRYGAAQQLESALAQQSTLIVSGWDEEGALRAIELKQHPFFVGTLFQSERAALDGTPVPLAYALLRAACAEFTLHSLQIPAR